jgi:Putative peptidoglycan binding domain
MPTAHVIASGECTLSIAADTGFLDWKPIWNATENEELRQSRKSPFALLPGDTLTIPDVKTKMTQHPTDAVHRFVVKRLRATLRVRLLQRDSKGEEIVIAGASCHLKIDTKVTDATTDGAGWLEVVIEPTAGEAELKVDKAKDHPALAWHLTLGTVLPDTETQGALNRLANLGYQAPGEAPEAYLPYAIRAFQEDAGIAVTGDIDEATMSELAKRHAI